MLGTSQTLNKGRYQVINSFSKDASGAMYEAVDTVSNIPVILRESVGRFGKVATASQINASNAAFVGEARVLAEIEHESVVSVRDYFSEIDRQYLVLESLTGHNLAKYFEPGAERPSVSDVLAWADQLLHGLEYLHKHTPPIIHTQIKPENLKLTSNLRIKLLTTKVSPGGMSNGFAPDPLDEDPSFGYRPLEQLWPHLGQVSQRVILNSYDERAAGELIRPLDARTDLYSAAASLYHVLTGKMPCDALERSIAILDGKPDPLQKPCDLDKTVPTEISDVFMRALAMRRENRFESAVLMRQMLGTAVTQLEDRLAGTVPVKNETPVSFPSSIIELAVDDRENEIQAEQARLDEDQKRLEQRKLELEDERERHAIEREKQRVTAENEQKRLARQEMEHEAEEERRRVAQRLSDLEAESARERSEEDRLEREAESERLRAEERLRELKIEQERNRAEQKRIEQEARLELERAEERIKTLSGSVKLSDLQQEVELGGDVESVFSVPTGEAAWDSARLDNEADVLNYNEQPGFNWRMPAIVGAVALSIAAGAAAWQFTSSVTPSPAPQQVQVPAVQVEHPPVATTTNDPSAPDLSANTPAQPADSAIPTSEEPATDGTQSTAPQQRRPQSAALQQKRPATEKTAPAKKKVTVDDLINDN
ncbi:MAG: protein kinase [Pyrinomonadaceae bacterium]